MTHSTPWRPFLAFAACLTLACSSAHAREPVTVAVFNLDAAEPRLQETGSQVSLLLNTQLSQSADIWTVERQDLASVLGEQTLGASGLVDSSTAAKIGHLTGAKVIILGRVFALGRDTMVVLKIISTETSRSLGQSLKLEPGTKLDVAVAELGKTLAAQIITHADTLVPPSTTPEQRVEMLRRKVDQKVLPSLRISIPEQHINHPVIDPAAQTEIARTLITLGAKVLASDSTEAPAIQIRGEAFSEAGVRFGGLLSCRARVEIEVVDTKSGRILLADRQVAVAFDTAESVAAKAALQNAGDALTERILQALLAQP